MVGTSKAASEASSTPSTPSDVFLRVVRGGASPEEIAALVAVLASVGGGEEPAPRPPAEWSAPRRRLRPTLPHGVGGWRSSALPG